MLTQITTITKTKATTLNVIKSIVNLVNTRKGINVGESLILENAQSQSRKHLNRAYNYTNLSIAFILGAAILDKVASSLLLRDSSSCSVLLISFASAS